jgi:tripartite ATP-independent transporter DctP family solute receptor
MSTRRDFLKASAVVGAGAVTGGLPTLAHAQARTPAVKTSGPIRITMAGYAPANNGFSLSLKRIGDRIQGKFGKDVDVKYLYNIIDLGYKGEDLPWLVEDGVLTMAYQSSSYFTDQIPDLGIADMPFLFTDQATARAAMDGKFGATLAERMETQGGYRILGWFENGFRHISNSLRPIHTPADMKGMRIRVLPSKVQERTFQLLGAVPRQMDLSELVPAIKAGTIDAQENPFSNTVTYGIHQLHKFHTASNHFYLSRPVFFSKRQFDAWPKALQDEMRAAVKDAVAYQRGLHVKEEEDAMVEIKKVGGTIVELTPAEHQQFVDAVKPIYGEARGQYDRTLLSLVNLGGS